MSSTTQCIRSIIAPLYFYRVQFNKGPVFPSRAEKHVFLQLLQYITARLGVIKKHSDSAFQP